MARPSSQFRLIDRLLQGRLAETLAAWHEEGISWDEMAKRLYADQGIEVHGNTLRNWHRRLTDAAEVA